MHDGHFQSKKVRELTIIEVKSGNFALSEAEKSIEKAIEKGKFNFELLRV